MKKLGAFVGARAAGFALVVVFAAVVARPAAAQTETASEFIATLGDGAIQMLVAEGLTDAERIANFRGLLLEGFDVPLIGRFALGVHWRRANAEQRSEYIDLFRDFLVQVYASRLGQYGGETLRVESSRTEGRGDTIVGSVILQRGGPPVKVEWRVRVRGEKYKVVDVIVEGISMVITQRDEFASVISRSGGNLEGLLAKLREKSP